MTTARDIMHTGATCVGEHETPPQQLSTGATWVSVRCRSAATTTACTE